MSSFLRKSRRRYSPLVASVLGLMAMPLVADTTLDDVYAVAEAINNDARASQAKITEDVDATNELLNDYKAVLKINDGLRVYNRQLERQIANQERQIATLNKSIDDVTVIQRQIVPLMWRMIDGLEQFVDLDMPFLLEERRDRIDRLRDLMERADVAVSEQFSQVLRAYQIENEYGRTLTPYTGEISVDGQTRIVDILQVGRVALIYQTTDASETGFWNKKSRQWEVLGDEFTTPTRNGLKMARKQLTSGLFVVPVHAPGGSS
ncbi:MAG: DUF3450 domain-containing protein [Gammaproteobacteria bacterium]|nr:DUF3450 domain-containing protein [Gammaproteobacteria bacterium]